MHTALLQPCVKAIAMDHAQASHYHRPVLLAEMLSVLRPGPGGLFVDGTLGGGGHTRAILETGASVIALDQDPDALANAEANLKNFGANLRLVQGNFRDLRKVLNTLGVDKVDGILLDLGVSSWQLDTASRGFSFQKDGPLDMRMGPGCAQNAADLVNTAPAEQLEQIFRELGEEPRARAIARRIVEERASRPFQTTLDLASSVERLVHRTGRRHPATKVFQGLRLAVNDETGALRAVLDQAADCLEPGARFAVITFHSLEDRMVKQFFREASRRELDRPEWPAPRPNPDCVFIPVRETPLVPSEEEIRENPRARSARLRAVERITS